MNVELSPLNNPFSILRLSADSSATKIAATSSQLLIKLKLANNQQSAKEIACIQTATDSLRDPLRRFNTGCYWLTFTSDEQNLWLNSLSELFSDHWTTSLIKSYEIIANSVEESGIYQHNKAVLYLGVALSSSIKEDLDSFKTNWASAFESWLILAQSDQFSKYLLKRCDELDDPRIKQHEVVSWISTIPDQILSFCQIRASGLLAENNVDGAKHYTEVIASSVFDQSSKNTALEKIYDPISSRVITKLETLNEKLQRVNRTEGKSKSELIEIFENFKSDIASDLNIFLEIGDLPGLAEEFARDECSKFLHKLSVRFYNDEDDITLSEEALSLASKFADSTALSSQLDTSKETLTSNKRIRTSQGQCAWCKGEVSGDSFQSVTLYKVTERGYRSVNYKSLTLELPSCTKCNKFHPIGCLLLLTFVVGLPVAGFNDLFAEESVNWMCIIGGPVSAGIFGFIKQMVDNGKIKNHPSISDYLDKGWKFGKPSAR